MSKLPPSSKLRTELHVSRTGPRRVLFQRGVDVAGVSASGPEVVSQSRPVLRRSLGLSSQLRCVSTRSVSGVLVASAYGLPSPSPKSTLLRVLQDLRRAAAARKFERRWQRLARSRSSVALVASRGGGLRQFKRPVGSVALSGFASSSVASSVASVVSKVVAFASGALNPGRYRVASVPVSRVPVRVASQSCVLPPASQLFERSASVSVASRKISARVLN